MRSWDFRLDDQLTPFDVAAVKGVALSNALGADVP
jgi:hypothetical protein